MRRPRLVCAGGVWVCESWATCAMSHVQAADPCCCCVNGKQLRASTGQPCPAVVCLRLQASAGHRAPVGPHPVCTHHLRGSAGGPACRASPPAPLPALPGCPCGLLVLAGSTRCTSSNLLCCQPCCCLYLPPAHHAAGGRAVLAPTVLCAAHTHRWVSGGWGGGSGCPAFVTFALGCASVQYPPAEDFPCRTRPHRWAAASWTCKTR